MGAHEGLVLPSPSLWGRNSSSSSFRLPLPEGEWEERKMFSCPCPLSQSPTRPPTPTPYTPFQLWRPFASKLGAASSAPVPLLPHPHRLAGPGPGTSIPFQHPRATLPTPRHILRPDPPWYLDPRTQTHPCPPPSTTRPGSHLGAPRLTAAQRAALLQLGSDAAPPPPPSPPPSRLPPLPSTGPGAPSQACS